MRGFSESGDCVLAEAYFVKQPNGTLSPAYEADRETLSKIKAGSFVRLKLNRARNYQFHRKYFALINFSFDYFEIPDLPDDPEKKWMKHVMPGKNIDRIRKDLTILAGYHEVFYRVDDSVRIEAQSISFGSMSEDDFEKLYSATIEVVLKHVCKQFTGKMLDEVVDQALSYAA